MGVAPGHLTHHNRLHDSFYSQTKLTNQLDMTVIQEPPMRVHQSTARRIIVENKNARVGVVQYNNGSKELDISLPGRGSCYSAGITSADESTLVLLAENKISCNTHVQGRDFGYRQPSRWLSRSCSFILAAGAVLVLWWAWKKERRVPAPAESRVWPFTRRDGHRWNHRLTSPPSPCRPASRSSKRPEN